jgi:hypothetical protein
MQRENLKYVFDILYEKVSLFRRTIDVCEIQFDDLVEIQNNVSPFGSLKVKLDGGAYKGKGFPCFFSPEIIDNFIFKRRTPDGSKNVRILALAAIAAMLYAVYYCLSPSAYYLESIRADESLRNGLGKKYNDINWNKLWDSVPDGVTYTNNFGYKVHLKIEDLLKIKEGKLHTPPLTKVLDKFTTVLEYLNFFFQTWNSFYYFNKNSNLPAVVSAIGTVLAGILYYLIQYFLSYLTKVLLFLGLCVNDKPDRLITQNGETYVHVPDGQLPALQQPQFEQQSSIRRSVPNQQFPQLMDGTVSSQSSSRQSIVLSLQTTPQRQRGQSQIQTDVTPPQSPPESVTGRENSVGSPVGSPVRQRRSSRSQRSRSQNNDSRSVNTERFEGGLKRRSRSRSRSRTRSKTKKNVLKVLYCLYDPSNQIFRGGARKGTFLCTIQTWGATLLFLTLVIYFLETYGTRRNFELLELNIRKLINSWLPEETLFFPKLNVLHEPYETGGGYVGLLKILMRRAYTLSEIIKYQNVFTFVSSYSLLVRIFKFIIGLLAKGPSYFKSGFVLLNNIFEKILCDADLTTIDTNLQNKSNEIVVQVQRILGKQ